MQYTQHVSFQLDVINTSRWEPLLSRHPIFPHNLLNTLVHHFCWLTSHSCYECFLEGEHIDKGFKNLKFLDSCLFAHKTAWGFCVLLVYSTRKVLSFALFQKFLLNILTTSSKEPLGRRHYKVILYCAIPRIFIFSISSSWFKSLHHTRFRSPFHSAFRASSSTEPLYQSYHVQYCFVFTLHSSRVASKRYWRSETAVFR